MENSRPPLILASASASRRALLHAAGVRFEVRPAQVDEAELKQAARAAGESAEAAALSLARAKAQAVSAEAPDALVIGADQMLECDGKWFDKPADLAEARSHLIALRGRQHGLATAVAASRRGKTVWQHAETPLLTMRVFSDHFLHWYLRQESDRLLGSVGAYRLEGPGVQLFERVEGDHSAILGLPLLPLLAWLRQEAIVLP